MSLAEKKSITARANNLHLDGTACEEGAGRKAQGIRRPAGNNGIFDKTV
jgi:hypothetical protein